MYFIRNIKKTIFLDITIVFIYFPPLHDLEEIQRKSKHVIKLYDTIIAKYDK